MNRSFEKLFYRKLKDKRHRVFVSVLCSIFRSVLVLLPTLLMRDIYNAAATGIRTGGFVGTVMLTVAIPIIVGVTFSIDIRLSKYFFLIIKEIRVQALSGLINRKLREVLSKNRSDLFQRMVVSLEELGEFYYYFVNTSTWYITTAVVGIALMLYINASITFVLIAFSVLQISSSLLIQKRIERTKEKDAQLQAKGLEFITRIIRHNAFIKTAKLGDAELETEHNWQKENFHTFRSRVFNEQIAASLSFAVVLLRTLYLLFAVRVLFETDGMLMGDFVALNSYIVWLTPVFAGLQGVVNDMINVRANKRRVDACLEEKPEATGMITPKTSLTEINVKKLKFAYEGSARNVITNLSFQVQAGEVLFITGASGSGKSTLLNILLGMEENYMGIIDYNGCDLRVLDEKWLHQYVVAVGQEVDILPRTLRDNLLYSGSEATDEEMKNTLHALRLEHLLDMPGGLDWNMKNYPRNLSDGERKRIAIARAILRRPLALILDEPTAGLDNVNKQSVMDYVRENMTGILIVATHDKVYGEADRVLNL